MGKSIFFTRAGKAYALDADELERIELINLKDASPTDYLGKAFVRAITHIRGSQVIMIDLDSNQIRLPSNVKALLLSYQQSGERYAIIADEISVSPLADAIELHSVTTISSMQ